MSLKITVSAELAVIYKNKQNKVECIYATRSAGGLHTVEYLVGIEAKNAFAKRKNQWNMANPDEDILEIVAADKWQTAIITWSKKIKIVKPKAESA